jgi:hypothetical protein
VKGLHIEREFIYWTNLNSDSSVHKGFTEPFVEAVPISSYYVEAADNCNTITSNDYYVFYTGSGEVYGHLKHASSTTIKLEQMSEKID